MITPLWLSGSWQSLSYSYVYSCHLLISPASVRSFIMPIFAWNVPLMSLIFLERSLVFTILSFSYSSLHWSLRKAFLSLLDIVWNSAFKRVYLSFSPLPLSSLLFPAICKASSDKNFAFLHSLSWGWSWSFPPVQCPNPLFGVLQALFLSDLSLESTCHFHCTIIRYLI